MYRQKTPYASSCNHEQIDGHMSHDTDYTYATFSISLPDLFSNSIAVN